MSRLEIRHIIIAIALLFVVVILIIFGVNKFSGENYYTSINNLSLNRIKPIDSKDKVMYEDVLVLDSEGQSLTSDVTLTKKQLSNYKDKSWIKIKINNDKKVVSVGNVTIKEVPKKAQGIAKTTLPTK